jgi:cytochrome c-type biogenesis protein
MNPPLLLAVTAGMLGAVNPCGFALLPAYLSVLVAGDRSRPDSPRAVAAAIGRAVRCTAALTAGYVAVFGAFGLVLAPITGWLQPRLPWLTVALGASLAAAGAWLVAGRSLPLPGRGMPLPGRGLSAPGRGLPLPGRRISAPRLTGSPASMVLFGMAYALASVGCAIGPFLAIVVSSLRAGSFGVGLLLFVCYAAGMGLVIGVTAIAVALVRAGAVAGLRRASRFVPRIGGAVLVAAGAYVAYYGAYELRLVKNLRTSGHDPVVNVASGLQHRLSDLVGRVGAAWLVGFLLVLIVVGLLASRRPRTLGVDGR